MSLVRTVNGSVLFRLTKSNSFVSYNSGAPAHLSCETLLPPHHHNISVWNSTLKSHIENKTTGCALLVFRQLLQSNVKPNDLTFSLLLISTSSSSSCSSLLKVEQEAHQIHTHFLKSGFDRFVYVATALLNLYAKCGSILLAYQLFEDMPNRDLVSWNALISGYSYNGYDYDALELFSEFLKQGLKPCRVTLVSVIPSCVRLRLVFQGKSIHGLGFKLALDLDSRVKNSLADMYAKCSDLDATRSLFEEMSEKSIISWNTMISAYGQNGFFDEALTVFKQMLEENVKVNSVTIMSLLSANNAQLGTLHSYAIKTGLETDYSVVTSLVCMYSRCGNTESAGLLHNLMPHKNLVSSTSIISSYADKGDMAMAVKCFNEIQLLDMKPDTVTMVSILHGFKNPSYIGAGISLHGYSIKSGLISETMVVNALVSMYTKVYDLEAAFSLFRSLHERPLISWNSMISGCVQAGRWSDAMEMFHQMTICGYNPDTITIVSMLSGCSQIESLQFGRKLHNYILRHNLQVEEDFVVTALIDMYAKCGSIKCAETLFQCITKPCLATWNAMILGYGMCGLELEALKHFSEMVKQDLKPDDITFLGVLSACSHGGLVDEGQKYFRIMTEEFGMTPGLQHCASMVDLLSRSGFLDEAVIFIKNMEVKPDSVVWLALLNGCCIHHEIKLGECVAKQILLLDHHNNCGFYVLMSNLYASIGRWNDVARVRDMMGDAGGDGFTGTSLIESTFFQNPHETVSNLSMKKD